MLKNVLIFDENSVLEEALRLLDENGNGVLPVVDRNNKFIGIITDGDIRRAFLNKNLSLNTVINRNPFTIRDTASKIRKIQFLKKIHRRHLPILNEKGELVDVFLLDEIDFNIKDNSVVIMAGGLGSRLGELTKNIPKPMLKVGEKPILEIILESFIDKGFNDFYISVNYKSDIIKNYFKDGRDYGVKIQYLEEDKPLGTVGGLTLIEPIPTKPFFLINGDILTDVNFEDVLNHYNKSKALATVCVRNYSFNVPYGVINTDGNNNIKTIDEKPKFNFKVNAGIYVLNPELLNEIPKNSYYDITSLFNKILKNKGKISTYTINGYWLDIGLKNDFKKANKEYYEVFDER